MNIGVLKERKRDERRVALRPDQAAALVQMGHRVFVEHNAGAAAGFPDKAYERAVIGSRDEIYERSTLLLKIKCPLPEEYRFLQAKHVLFCYFHFDENIAVSRIRQIVDAGVTGIAYEWVEKNGTLPLLWPMSELTGAVFARKTLNLLMEHAGLLGGDYCSTVPPARAMVIGLGHIGANAAHVFLRNGLFLVIVDKHPESVHERITRYVSPSLWKEVRDRRQIIHFEQDRPDVSVERIRKILPATDILINSAIRRPNFPKEQCKFLVDREGVASMRPNSVLSDATACDQDMVETAYSSESLTHTYLAEDVVHYNCDHIPSLVAGAATRLLTEATFRYIAALANGIEDAVKADESLYKGVMCYKGNLTHALSARKKNLKHVELKVML